MAGPMHPRTPWNWCLGIGVLIILASVPLFIAGIWGDDRWGGTGGIVAVVGIATVITAGIVLDGLPRR